MGCFVSTCPPGRRPYEKECSIALLLGFIGLHVAQRSRYGRLGTVGFATVLVGLVLITAGSVGEFWVFSDESYVGAGRNASWMLFLLGHPVLAIGTLLFGVATVRAKVFPRVAAVSFAVMGVGVIVPFFGAFIFALPFVWLGYLLWSGRFGRAQQPAHSGKGVER